METPTVEIPPAPTRTTRRRVSGGFTFARKAEAAAAAASRGMRWSCDDEGASLFGLAYATEEILTDSPHLVRRADRHGLPHAAPGRTC
jgi:hypothetical protein